MSDNLNYTPGPWKAERHATKYPDLFTWSIEQTYQHEGEPHRYGIVSEIDGEGDARLMAAAPELLEALKRMDALVESLWKSVPWGQTFNLDVQALNEAPIAAKRAIAKAEGR